MNDVIPTLSLKLKGYNEPPATFAEMGGSLLTSSASRVAIVPLYQEGGMMQVNPIKLQNTKSDRITTMQALPVHRMFILGTEGNLKRVFIYKLTVSLIVLILDGFLKVCA